MKYSLQRVGLACLGALGTIGLLALAACPGTLENPDQVIVAPAAGSPGTAGGGGDTVDLSCVTPLFKKSCGQSGCHGAMSPAASLDLVTPGFAARMVDVNAPHEQTNGPCTPAKLIDSANPAMSWLLIKVLGTQTTCGLLMPFGGTKLPDADLACITTFVNDEAAAHASTSAGTAGAGTSASSGGSSGASAGSGGM
ncbi:MAG: hypothetical protein ABJB12_21970 [Pseudomonadota bacterium]